MVEQRIVREDAQTRNLQKPRGAMRVMHGFHGTYRPGSRLRSGLPFGGFDAESKRLSETCGRTASAQAQRDYFQECVATHSQKLA
jgi:hypothetical protein